MGENVGALGDESKWTMSLRERSVGGGEGVKDILCVGENLFSTTSRGILWKYIKHQCQ